MVRQRDKRVLLPGDTAADLDLTPSDLEAEGASGSSGDEGEAVSAGAAVSLTTPGGSRGRVTSYCIGGALCVLLVPLLLLVWVPGPPSLRWTAARLALFILLLLAISGAEAQVAAEPCNAAS